MGKLDRVDAGESECRTLQTSATGRGRTRMTRMFTAAIATLLWASAAHAQSLPPWFLPDTRYFHGGLADPLDTRYGIGLLVSDLLAEPGPERPAFQVANPGAAASEVVASVALGTTFPLVELSRWEGGGAVLTGEVAVFGRFRIELPSRDDLGQDWVIALPLELQWDRWSMRFRLSHRSSHIGDEFAEATGAERIEFGGEALDWHGGYRVAGGVRVYGGASWIFRSYTRETAVLIALDRADRMLFQIGWDGAWDLGDTPLRLHAGMDWHAAERTNWRGGGAAVAGLGTRGPRALRLLARYYNGLSPLGEFFLTRERSLALELVAWL